MNFMRNIILTFLFIGIILIITSSFVINIVHKYEEKTFLTGYEVSVAKIEKALENMELIQGEDGFDKTIMYSSVEISDYSSTSGKFLEEYIGISKDCANAKSECFAPKYLNTDGKTEYTPEFEGACAILKNNMRICIKPQILDQNITGIIDLNGIKGPNTLGKDLRTFTIKAKEIKHPVKVEPREVETYQEEY